MTHDAFDVERRLGRLERRNQRLITLGTAIALGLTAIIVMGQAAPKSGVLEAQRVVLKDKTGKIRAVLGEGADGEIGLLVYDGKQRPRAMVAMDDNDLPMMRVLDDGGRERVVVDTISGVRIEGNGPRVILGVQFGNRRAVARNSATGEWCP